MAKKKPASTSTGKVTPFVIEMPPGEVSADGQEIVFRLKSIDGQSFEFRASTDAIDTIMGNLETLAISAMNVRRIEGTDRRGPHPDLKPMHSCGSRFIVEEGSATDPWTGLRLVIERYSRTPIHIPLQERDFERLVKALREAPIGKPPAAETH